MAEYKVFFKELYHNMFVHILYIKRFKKNIIILLPAGYYRVYRINSIKIHREFGSKKRDMHKCK